MMDFLIPIDTSGSAGVFVSFSARDKHRRISVPVNKLDDLVDYGSLPGKVVIKLDIEGSEFVFLSGAKQMLFRTKPILIMEINPKTISASGRSGKELATLLKEVGFKYFNEMDLEGTLSDISSLDMKRFRNVIFTMDPSMPQNS
jgi:hypothetical protein